MTIVAYRCSWSMNNNTLTKTNRFISNSCMKVLSQPSDYPHDDEDNQQDGGSHRQLAVVDADLLPAGKLLLYGIGHLNGIDA